MTVDALLDLPVGALESVGIREADTLGALGVSSLRNLACHPHFVRAMECCRRDEDRGDMVGFAEALDARDTSMLRHILGRADACALSDWPAFQVARWLYARG